MLTNVAVPDQARMAASPELAEMVQPLIDDRLPCLWCPPGTGP
jgi:hypothetical protein